MTPRVKIPAHIERAIVEDYQARTLSLKAIGVKHDVSEYTVNLIRLRHGLRRYQTHAAATSPRLVRAAAEADPQPTLYRCRCGGRATNPAGHPRCREAA